MLLQVVSAHPGLAKAAAAAALAGEAALYSKVTNAQAYSKAARQLAPELQHVPSQLLQQLREELAPAPAPAARPAAAAAASAAAAAAPDDIIEDVAAEEPPSVEQRVHNFIGCVLEPLVKAGVVGQLLAEKVAGKATAKVMKRHADADDVQFLVREYAAVTRLVTDLTDHYQRQGFE
ncbi:hypothetical protein OEZ86_013936 [Tetradesmus obliquus]|nr:hypothetical protein OEZ86_013936 [Tetradesmus obliquus]